MVDKDWTFEEAWEAQQRAEKAGLPGGRLMAGPLWQWGALHELDLLEGEVAKGERGALMVAIYTCAMHDLVMPDWVSKAFLEGYRKVVQHRAGSWDDAFGRPHPKGNHLEQARQRWEKKPRVFVRVKEILETEPQTQIDNALFERVGKELGVSRSQASKLYYEMKALLPPKS